MKKRWKKLAGILAGAAILTGAMSVTAFAENADSAAAFAEENDSSLAGESEYFCTVDGNGGVTEDGRTSYTYPLEDENDYSFLDKILEKNDGFTREGYRQLGWAKNPDVTNDYDIEEDRALYLDPGETAYAIWAPFEEVQPDVKKHIASEDGADRWYFFTPEESGYYFFTFTDVTGNDAFVDVYEDLEFDNRLVYFGTYENNSVCELEGGKSCGIQVSISEGAAFDLCISHADTILLDGNGGKTSDERTVLKAPKKEGESLGNILDYSPVYYNSFEREGYKLVGWSASPSASPIGLTDALEIYPKAGETYYAIWQRIVTITLHGNGSKTSDGDETYVYTEALEGELLEDYSYLQMQFTTPEGYWASGLALTADASSADNEATVTEGMVAYAVWEPRYYMLDLNANGGSFPDYAGSYVYTGGYYNARVDYIPDNPVSETPGMVFDAWYYDEECTRPLGMSLEDFRLTDDITLYAGYKMAATPVTEIVLSKEKAPLIPGKTLTLKATVLPDSATNKAVVWSSDNRAVATVSSKGVVKGISVGIAYITVRAKDGGGASASCKIVVREPVTQVKLSKTAAAVLKGKTLTLKASALPTTAGLRTVSWSSSNKNIATVTSKGVVKGVAVGTAVITAKAKDGSGVKATCKIVVRQPVTKLTISKTKLAVKQGKTATLTVTASPASAYNKAVTWSSENKKIATVNSKGVVKGIAKGTVIITAKAKDGSGKTVKCKVTVK